VTALLPGLTALLALIFGVALLDQWRERRRAYQLTWAVGMLFFGVAATCEAIAAATGAWDPARAQQGGLPELLYRTWYLTGAVWTAGWLGLGTAFLLGRTRFGYGFAFCLLLAGVFTFLAPRRDATLAGAGSFPILYLVAAVVLALAVAVETYFQNVRWPWFAAVAVVGATLLSSVLMVATTLPFPGYAIDPRTLVPVATILPANLRLLTPFMNVTGAFALVLGALFSAYVFMPKRRVLDYSLDPGQPGDQFLFNLAIAPVAITVNFLASLPGAIRALFAGQLHSRVPATFLIAIGAFIPTITDSLNRFGSTQLYQAGKFLGVLFLFGGFVVSVETFGEIRVPFTHRVLRARRHESGELAEP